MPRRQTPPRTGKQRPRPEEARRPADIVKETSPKSAIPAGKPLMGSWLFTTRAGSEQDLVEELQLARIESVVRAPGLVESRGAPTFDDGTLDTTFGRQGFRLRGTLTGETPALLARTFASRAASLAPAGTPLALSVFSPDTDEGNRLAALGEEIEHAAIAALANRKLVPLANATHERALVVQAAMLTPTELAFGDVPSAALLSPFAGGRARMAVAGDRPSRAARKVEEALHWLGSSPTAGEVCVDLGAAPGGWSWALLDKRCRVIAIDPAELHPDVAAHPKLTHEKASAFAYVPVDPVDWLFCDMAWRPLEVAQMLAKWARKGYARALVSNIKLPMKKKAEVVREVREIVHGGGWKRVRTRQLYHDRDEITLTAHR
jgi:23S rRNA (cytidine2498-2'-O)-methyltransferase